MVGKEILRIEPTYNILLYGPTGKKCVIDFSGDKVICTGDLPLDDAAKVFFEAVGGLLTRYTKGGDQYAEKAG